MERFILGNSLESQEFIDEYGVDLKLPLYPQVAAVAKFKLGMPWGRLAGFWVLGILFWNLVEYLLHRFGFHTAPRTAAGNKAHHHRDPDALFGVSSPLWDLVFRTGSSQF